MSNQIKYYETQYWGVNLNENQTYIGYSIVYTKRQVSSISEITKEKWDDFHEIVKLLENTFKKALGSTLFNWVCLMNHAYKEKPYNPWVHWHLIPRYENEVKFEGITFKDPNFGHHYNRKIKNIVSKENQELIVKRIKDYL